MQTVRRDTRYTNQKAGDMKKRRTEKKNKLRTYYKHNHDQYNHNSNVCWLVYSDLGWAWLTQNTWQQNDSVRSQRGESMESSF